MNISVVICTYNRSESLNDTLDSLFHQERNGNFDYEVIVVDNNSKDKTKQVVESYKGKFNGNLKYFFESNQGLSYARNKGIKESKGEIIAFTDDDCTLPVNWLMNIYSYFQNHTEVDIVLGEAITENGLLVYKTDSLLRGNGLNMIFLKKVFCDLGYFDTYLGAGSVGCSADDVEFIYRAMKKNKIIKICKDIKVIHKNRDVLKEKLKIVYRDCKGYTIFWIKYIIKEKDLFALKNFYWFYLSILSDLISALFRFDQDRIKLKLSQLSGAFIGTIKAFFIYIVYYAKS